MECRRSPAMQDDVAHKCNELCGDHCSPATERVDLCHANVFAAGSLRALTALERNCLSLAQIVEPRRAARGVVKEVLVDVTRQDEAKTFVRDETLDRAVH